jgi:hypothetical protein
MDYYKYWLIKQLDLDNDSNHIIVKQLLNPLCCFTDKLHIILDKPFSISKISKINLNKLLNFLEDTSLIQYKLFMNKMIEDKLVIHCSRGYNTSFIQNLLSQSENIVVFKYAFSLYSKNYPNLANYNIVMNYIEQNPHKLYIFGNKKSECNFPKLHNVCYLDE